MRYNKYGNCRAEYNGYVFDSKAEMERYKELLLLLRAGVITDLKLQPAFELIPKNGKERGVTYKADFSYIEDGKEIVEDVKGYRTKEYILKRKLFKWRYADKEFREIGGGK